MSDHEMVYRREWAGILLRDWALERDDRRYQILVGVTFALNQV
jgi:hypothetical protein